MAKEVLAKLFRNGRSQAVRLPKEFRFEGDRVLIRRVRNGVLLQPVKFNVREWFAEIDRLRGDEPFMKEGRNQPRTPKRDVFK
ncbi:MAG TPA: type II toxin-antitoxin system VapB family antitoxin [Terriglobales bacterium]|nr:type II toxin-antitoxin system VapB family antitoxin [Terriglobales bacterium]